MKQKIFWIGLSIVIAIAPPLMSIQNLNAALPPISPQNLKRLSDYIVIGQVTRIESREVALKFGPNDQYSGTNIQYKAIVKVQRLESKKDPGRTIEVHYWTVGKRPSGMAGAQGQNLQLKKQMTAKFFIRKDKQGKLHLLEPNGWQPIN